MKIDQYISMQTEMSNCFFHDWPLVYFSDGFISHLFGDYANIYIWNSVFVYPWTLKVYQVGGQVLVMSRPCDTFVKKMNTYPYQLKRWRVWTMYKSCHMLQSWHLVHEVRILSEGLKFSLSIIVPCFVKTEYNGCFVKNKIY